jgi:plastocyanin
MRTLTLLLSLLALGALGLVACGGDDDDDEDTVATQAIRMTEYAFDPADVTVGGGDTITATNDGQLPHNYTVIGAGGAGAVEAVTGDVDPGSTGEITLNLQSGEYEVICTIPGHAEQGMRGTLTVREG